MKRAFPNAMSTDEAPKRVGPTAASVSTTTAGNSIMRLALVITMLLLGWPEPAASQPTYPSKPIQLVVGFAPGGGADLLARLLSEQLGQQLGQKVIVVNRTGASSTIAAEHVAQSPPDGHTLFLGTANLYGGDQYLYGKNVRYEGVRDFTPISRWTSSALIVAVNKDSGMRTVQDLITRSRNEPGKLFYASAGGGVATHLAGSYFEKLTGGKLTHVPYKGGAPAVQSVIAGDTQLTFGTPPSVMPFIQAGRLTGLAVTSRERSYLFPDLPSVAEAGVPNFDITYWYGLFGPANLPKAVVDKLFDAGAKVLGDPEVRKRVAQLGLEVKLSQSAVEFRELAIRDGAEMRELMQMSGAKTD